MFCCCCCYFVLNVLNEPALPLGIQGSAKVAASDWNVSKLNIKSTTGGKSNKILSIFEKKLELSIRLNLLPYSSSVHLQVGNKSFHLPVGGPVSEWIKSFSGLCTMKADFMQTASKNLNNGNCVKNLVERWKEGSTSVLVVADGCSEHSWESPDNNFFLHLFVGRLMIRLPPSQGALRCCQSLRNYNCWELLFWRLCPQILQKL